MNPPLSRKWLQFLLIALIPMLFAVGCAKRDAQKSLDAANVAKEESSVAQAPRYAKKTFDDANNLLRRAQSEFDQGEYKQSIETAGQAVARFEAAKIQVPQVKERVDTQMGKIKDAIASAEENVKKARETGTPEAVNPVDALVTQIKTRSDEDLANEVDQQKLDNFLAEVNLVVAQTEALANAHLQPQAAQAKQEIQQLVSDAQMLKADAHVPDKYNEVMEKIKAMDSAERDGKWQDMITIAGEVRQPLNEIISAAQEKAAGDILQEILGEIAKAKQLSVPDVEAYNTSVAQAEETLKTGQTELQNQQYANVIAAANECRRLLSAANESLGGVAQQSVDKADANVQEAIAKEAPKYAPAVLAQVQEAIAGVKDLIQNKQFAAAYANAKKVEQASLQAIAAARSGKAQTALAKVEGPFSILYGQGGSQYASEAYSKVEAAVKDLRDKMKSGEYEAVESGVDAAAALADEGIKALEKAAGDFIAKTQTALDDAKTAKATEWVGMQYANAVNLKAAAAEELNKQRFLSSIRKSEAAIQAAKESEGKAYQLQSNQNLNKANDFMILAKQARQDQLSPLAYRKAMEAREETTALIAKKEFKPAYQKSIETAQLSEDALNNLVIAARNKTDSALQAQSMTYSEPEIQNALSLLNQAEEAQKAHRYEDANRLAIESAQWAEKAEYFTWKQRSYALLKELEGMKEQLDRQLAPEKKPSLYSQSLVSLAEAKVKQIDQEYKASYEHADAACQARDQIYAGMKEDLERSAAEYSQTASWIGEHALDQEGREIKTGLLDGVAELQRLISLQDWKAAFAKDEEVRIISQKTTAKTESRNRSILAYQLKSELKPYEKQDALSIVPEQAQALNGALKSLSSPQEGETYADVYKKYEEAVKTKEKLPESIQQLAAQRTEEIGSTLKEAQDAGALKYYRDWFRTLSSDLQWLRNSVRGDDYKGIATRLKKLEKEAPEILVSTKTAVEEDNYLQSLNDFLKRMNTTLQDFGFIGAMPRDLILAARSTEHKLDETLTDMYRALQGKLTAKNFLLNAQSLEESVKEMAPPKSLESFHKKAIASFTHFRKAAEGFYHYGQSDAFDLKYRERKLDASFDHLYKTRDINEDLMFVIDSFRKMEPMEKFYWDLRRYENKVGDFYFSYETE
ncbi:MAG: hypothetical protein AB1656_26455 [Candidatus Omnitrophota bacterium]